MAKRQSRTPTGRWWKQPTGRWRAQLEAALASDDPGRIGIAWAIIKQTGGEEHGDIKEAAVAFRVDNKLLSAQLTGAKPVTLPVLRKIEAATGTKLSVLTSGAHPFAVPMIESEGYCEPGDPNWETVYSALRVMEPDVPSESELRSAYPQLFPKS